MPCRPPPGTRLGTPGKDREQQGMLETKILRRKEEETDGLPMESLQKDGGEANIPPDHKSRTLPTNLEMPEEVLQFMPADIGQTNGSNCLPAQLVAGMNDGVCGTVMKQRYSRPFTVFKTNL